MKTIPIGTIPLPVVCRVADVCVRKLARAFCEKCPPPDAIPLPEELDDLSLACLLLAAEWGGRSSETTAADLAACLEKVSGRFWGDLLPWQLALAFCRKDESAISSRMETLAANLDHHRSDIRLWMFDVAWCVRNKLNPVESYSRLLKNVANTLAYWDSSLGLCRALFPAGPDFWRVADAFEPPDFREQYRDRIAFARKEGLSGFQSGFERTELRLRRLICETALGLDAEDSTNEG